MDESLRRSVFEVQEKVIADLLQKHEEKAALESVPQVIDPIQQTVATAVQQSLNHPQVDRKRGIAAIAFLNKPMLRVQVSELKKLYKEHQRTHAIPELIAAVEKMSAAYGTQSQPAPKNGNNGQKLLREDLRLICFDVVSSA